MSFGEPLRCLPRRSPSPTRLRDTTYEASTIWLAGQLPESVKEVAHTAISTTIDALDLVTFGGTSTGLEKLGEGLSACGSYTRKGLRAVGVSQRTAQNIVDWGNMSLMVVPARGVVGGALGTAGTLARGVKASALEFRGTPKVAVAKYTSPPVALKVTYAKKAEIGMEFGQGIQKQGLPFEDFVGRMMAARDRLPAYFKTFDYWNPNTKVATSVKTLDTSTVAKIAFPEQVFQSLKKNIDATVKFEEYGLGDVRLTSAEISARELHVAVPLQTTGIQWGEISRAIQYGEQQGVKVFMTVVE